MCKLGGFGRSRRESKRDGQVGPINPFHAPRGSALTCKSSGVRQSKITKGTVWAGLGGKGLIYFFKLFSLCEPTWLASVFPISTQLKNNLYGI